MKTFISWVKNTLLAIILSTAMILLFKYAIKIEMSILRIVMVYIVLFIFINIMWIIKGKKIKFDKIKYSIFMGVFGWGITTGTLMNIALNNPFTLNNAILVYIVFMLGGFVWGITMYAIRKKLKKKNNE